MSMPRPKYSYTYAPDQKRRRRKTGGGFAIPPQAMFVLPVVLVLVVVLMSRVLGGGGTSDSPEVGACPGGEGCPVALSASQTPTPAEPTPTPAVASDVPDVPAILGVSAAVIEQPCGVLLYETNGALTLPPASLTKIVTALVAVDWAELSEVVTVEIDGPALSLETDSTVMGIEPGDELSMRDLLYGLLLRSGNDVALEIARHIAGGEAEFVELMNDKLAELGLVDSQFTNPHGLDDFALYSSAIDMVRLGAALLENSDLAEIVATQEYQPAWDGPALSNLNLLLHN